MPILSGWVRGSLLALGCCLVGFAPALSSTLMRAQELPAVVAESERAALVTVVDVRYMPDEAGRPSTHLVLELADPLYGFARGERQVAIKLFGAPVPMPDGHFAHIDGTPRFTRGQRYLLLLRGTSPWGFTGIAGHVFGAFRVEEDEDTGELLAFSTVRGRDVFGPGGLAQWLEGEALEGADARRLAEPDAPVPYEMLRRAVLRLAREKKGGQR